MSKDDLPAQTPERGRGAVRYSRRVADAICGRVAAGEALGRITSEDGMPGRWTVAQWAKDIPAFAEALRRAKQEAGRSLKGGGAVSTYCPVTAREICRRVAEGESVKRICEDPDMPSFSTVYLWRRTIPDFAQQLKAARETLAERFCDDGWDLAMQATPETAYLTHVRLSQLRWMAGILSPRVMKPKPADPPPEPEVQYVCVRQFHLERNYETGMWRTVGYTPDPQTNKPVRDCEGEWTPMPQGQLEKERHPSARKGGLTGDLMG